MRRGSAARLAVPERRRVKHGDSAAPNVAFGQGCLRRGTRLLRAVESAEGAGGTTIEGYGEATVQPQPCCSFDAIDFDLSTATSNSSSGRVDATRYGQRLSHARFGRCFKCRENDASAKDAQATRTAHRPTTLPSFHTQRSATQLQQPLRLTNSSDPSQNMRAYAYDNIPYVADPAIHAFDALARAPPDMPAVSTSRAAQLIHPVGTSGSRMTEGSSSARPSSRRWALLTSPSQLTPRASGKTRSVSVVRAVARRRREGW
jgi:hypothetical protein